MPFNKYFKLLFIVGIISISFFSCKKEKTTTLPYAPVNVYINTTLPQYQNLTSVGGWVYTNGGNNGLIVVRTGIEQAMAYDRYCTFDAPNSCGSGSVDSTNIQISCGCDGSIYNLFDGTVTQGPATIPLIRYSTTFDGTTIHITN